MPPLLDTVATRGEGLEDLIGDLERHREYLRASGRFASRLGERNQRVLLDEITAALRDQLVGAALSEPAAAAIFSGVREGSVDPYSAARMLLERWSIAPKGTSC